MKQKVYKVMVIFKDEEMDKLTVEFLKRSAYNVGLSMSDYLKQLITNEMAKEIENG
jgi:translation elongation factor EF-4